MSVAISEEELHGLGRELVSLTRAVSRKMGWPEGPAGDDLRKA